MMEEHQQKMIMDFTGKCSCISNKSEGDDDDSIHT